ncbi:NADH kinase [Basidiobolus meristosporus CBS 931.73]|uniref:NADH kinase n=1 Tax=Basidiobolus meristosporus CBS 931.73 TaxID=1314790 RepID=A0A1Y1XDS3_9FUNG|nr:NADH kinase [Basidiobolus meristosporus CBS 931.73]|eukprot:ORX83857.1 NADH kinase [Basidiobolus meristosporus CBS 931.73]
MLPLSINEVSLLRKLFASSGGFIRSRRFTSKLATTSVLPNKVASRRQPLPAGGKAEASPVPSPGRCSRLVWDRQPRTVLLVKKPNDPRTEQKLSETVRWIHERHPEMNIVLEPSVARRVQKDFPYVYVVPEGDLGEYERTVDFVVTLGGDGTIMHVSTLFGGPAPPVLSFSMGTLGFLIRHHIQDFEQAFDRMLHGKVSLLDRMRLVCSIYRAEGERMVWKKTATKDMLAMNEINVHRGRSPHLARLDVQVNGHDLTTGLSDGLLIATPTGSTAYSLSAGGAIVHPAVQTLLLTPVCPRSLSFRPVLFPIDTSLRLKLSTGSRGRADVSIDGRVICVLPKGGYVEVRASQYPLPCVNNPLEGNAWVRDINQLLKWNQGFATKTSVLENHRAQ